MSNKNNLFLRIATWNIGGWFISSNLDNIYDRENINYFIEKLRSINPDIVCFQEIHVSPDNNQPKIIADSLGFKYVSTFSIADSHLKDSEKLSISIISRFNIVSSKFNMLRNPNLEFIRWWKVAYSHDKGFLEAIIDYNWINIRVLSGHMVPFRKFWKSFLEDEFKDIREQAENIIINDNIPKIVCADMNFDGEIEKLLPRVFNKDFKFILDDTQTTPKWRRYDKIIISSDWNFVDSEIMVDSKADHFLCYADVELISI